MRLNWKRWEDGKGMSNFLDDNGISLRTISKGKTKQAEDEIVYVFILKDNTVLGAVRSVTGSRVSIYSPDYFPCSNNGTCHDLAQSARSSHRTFAAAVKDAISMAAPFFNKDGTPTSKTYLPGVKRNPGKILWSRQMVLETEGNPSWINGKE